jgi:hypothetical protein
MSRKESTKPQAENKIRDWLERNKVFFDLLLTLTLVVAAIISLYRTDLLQRKQLKFEQVDHDPRITIDSFYDSVADASGVVRKQHFIDVENTGFKLNKNNLDIEINFFLRVQKVVNDEFSEYYFVLHPVVKGWNVYADSSPLLKRYFIEDLDAKVHSLWERNNVLIKSLLVNQGDILLHKIITVCKISYIDVDGEETVQYIEVDIEGGEKSKKMPREKGDYYFKFENRNSGIDLDKVNSEDFRRKFIRM